MIMNRIADVFFIIAILCMITYYKTADYTIILSNISRVDNIQTFLFVDTKVTTFITIFLTIGAMGKSAQFGFHT